MKDKPWSPPHILKGDDLISDSSPDLPTFLPHKNYTFTYDPFLLTYTPFLIECIKKSLKEHPYSPDKKPFGIEYWLTKPPTIGRLKKLLSRLNPIPKEKRMTKKKLLAKIKNLEYNVETQREAIKEWEEAYGDFVKKYKDLQQAVCGLAEKAKITQTEKNVFVPKSFSW